MLLTPTNAPELWHKAQASEFGVALEFKDPTVIDNCKVILYKARPETARNIALVLPNGGGQIWLVKRTVELGA